ncbi:hypothetical protein A8L34_11000 [Bacillus sp. FJAT-27264]|nr:hypothetical protein [Bacillus sp. FJAT-27264]OBZ14458.1 hypothetical protein A8L34_11000 [Bacillus sp. FJAT-27264]
MKNTAPPRIITLCGSTKFKRQFEEANAALTLKGYIVLSVGFFEQSEGITLTDEQIQLFENLHFQKIDMSYGILVINHGGYIGLSTQKEIEYAMRHGKNVEYWEPLS